VRELREVRDRLLQCTNQLSVDAALATIEDALRDRAELRSAEEAFGASLSADGWRSVSAEVEASRHLEQRVRAFAGVQSKDSGSLEAALRTLQHRERERLSLIQLRNDVLGAAAAAADADAKPEPAGEPSKAVVSVVRELVEQAEAVKAHTRTASFVQALATLKATPSGCALARRQPNSPSQPACPLAMAGAACALLRRVC
jgi:hypothetical protein